MIGRRALIFDEFTSFEDRSQPLINELLITGEQSVAAKCLQDRAVIAQPIDRSQIFRCAKIARMQGITRAGRFDRSLVLSIEGNIFSDRVMISEQIQEHVTDHRGGCAPQHIVAVRAGEEGILAGIRVAFGDDAGELNVPGERVVDIFLGSTNPSRSQRLSLPIRFRLCQRPIESQGQLGRDLLLWRRKHRNQ